MVKWMPKSINKSCKKICSLLLRVLSYYLITISDRIMIPSIQLNLRRSGCLKIMLIFCNGQVSPRIWIQKATRGDFWKFKSEKVHKQKSIIWRQKWQEDCYRIPTNYCKKLIENYRKRYVAVEWIKNILQSIKWRWYVIFVQYDYFFHSWKWINGIDFCKINSNLSLYTR